MSPKMRRGNEHTSLEKNRYMSNRQMKKMFIIKEIQTKTPVRHHLTRVRIIHIKKLETCVVRNMINEPPSSSGGNIWLNFCEKEYGGSFKNVRMSFHLTHKLYFLLSIPKTQNHSSEMHTHTFVYCST